MAGFANDLAASGVDAFSITPSSDALPNPTRAIYVETAGDLDVKMVGGTRITFPAVAAGLFPISVTHVYSDATTATGLIGVF